MRILKDIILERCKAFNAVALVDFVCFVLDDYHERRIMSYANEHNVRPEMHFRKLLNKSADLFIEKVNNEIYNVSPSSEEGLKYEVHVVNETCDDCPQGIGGRFCKHLCAVHVRGNVPLKHNPKLSLSDKVQLM